MYLCNEDLTKNMTIALAHEVKNPVSLIKANIELLELENILSNDNRNVTMIKNELNKICEIVSNFTLYCNQNYKPSITEINLLDLVKEYIENFSVYNNITFSINCFESMEDIIIKSDYSKLYLVISNIYKNCVEAIDRKNGFIQTNIYTKDNTIIIDFIDNGQGIDESILDKVYKPFFTSKSYGSGIGIPICMDIMKNLGGSFEIFNNDTLGCTTRLTLKKSII